MSASSPAWTRRTTTRRRPRPRERKPRKAPEPPPDLPPASWPGGTAVGLGLRAPHGAGLSANPAGSSGWRWRPSSSSPAGRPGLPSPPGLVLGRAAGRVHGAGDRRPGPRPGAALSVSARRTPPPPSPVCFTLADALTPLERCRSGHPCLPALALSCCMWDLCQAPGPAALLSVGRHPPPTPYLVTLDPRSWNGRDTLC